jgi:hypothetical protein
VYFNCVQRCQGIVTVVAVGCGPMVNPRFGRRLRSPSREPQPSTSHLRYVLNLNTSLSIYLFYNSRIHVITFYSGHVCVYYVSILRC